MKLLVYGLVTGIIFGFLLQRARVVRYDKQVGALRLMDMTILKYMLSAIVVGMFGIYLLHDLGLARIMVRPLAFGPNIIGGLLFGFGWGLLGYCPGTAWGALGEGRWDSLWGLLGMFAGGAVYAEIYPLLKVTVHTWGTTRVHTIPGLLGINHWFVIPVFAGCVFLLFRWFEKKGL